MTQRTLIVARHAHAASPFLKGDHGRPLSDRGVREAVELGRLLSDLIDVVDSAAVSDAERAKQTFEGIRKSLPIRSFVLDHDLYYAMGDEIVGAAQQFDDSVATGLIVCHQPGVGDVGHLLALPEDMNELYDGVPTATALILRFRGPWHELRQNSCGLKVVRVSR